MPSRKVNLIINASNLVFTNTIIILFIFLQYYWIIIDVFSILSLDA